jgi:hypothetical protein
MKYLISLLIACLGTGCATRKESTPQTTAVVPGTHVSAKRMAAVRTPEVVKAYSVGRYTDPNYPDEMHERHTVYRREQSPDWNYLPDPPPFFPPGNPPQSYGAGGSAQGNAKQRQYAEALQEQNRALQKRIEQLRQDADKLPGLQQELDKLKGRAGESPISQPDADAAPSATPGRIEEEDVFSAVEPELPAWEDDAPDPGNIAVFAESDDQVQDFLLSQMQLNDEFTTELAAAERMKISALLSAPFLRRREFALLNP